MELLSFLARLDVFHHHSRHRDPGLEKRMLSGHVFGVDLPGYIIFHAMLGYTLLGVGIASIILRLPVSALRRRRWLHQLLGYIWVFGTVWMPITAIWCVYSFTGWDVVAFFIFSMFAAIQVGWLCVRIFRGRRTQYASTLGTESVSKLPRNIKVWVILHGTFMVYSFAMLLGAGISFPFRANNTYAAQYKAYQGS